jgi:hypothetical protein
VIRWIARLRYLVGRWRRSTAHERALERELQAYLHTDIESRVRSGETPAEARRQALLALGGIEPVKEAVRDARTGAWVDGVRQDVRYAVRALRKSPGFTGSVVGSIALGMAAMIAGIAFANAILFRETPGVRDPQRLLEIRVEYQDRGWRSFRLAPRDYRLLAEGFRDVASIAVADSMDVGVALPAPRSLHGRPINCWSPPSMSGNSTYRLIMRSASTGRWLRVYRPAAKWRRPVWRAPGRFGFQRPGERAPEASSSATRRLDLTMAVSIAEGMSAANCSPLLVSGCWLDAGSRRRISKARGLASPSSIRPTPIAYVAAGRSDRCSRSREMEQARRCL